MPARGQEVLVGPGNGGASEGLPALSHVVPCLASRTPGKPISFKKVFSIGRKEEHSCLLFLKRHHKLSLNINIF